MKRALIVLLFLLAAAPVSSQDGSTFSVKDIEVNNGVVIISALDGGARFELRCNANMPSCRPLKPGKYVMVRLPKGQGMYECEVVDVYSIDLQPVERIGEYCVIR